MNIRDSWPHPETGRRHSPPRRRFSSCPPKPVWNSTPAQHRLRIQTHFSTQCGGEHPQIRFVCNNGGTGQRSSSIHVGHVKLASSRRQKMCSRMHWLVGKEGCSAKDLWTLPPEPLQRRPTRSWKYREGPCLFWRSASEGPRCVRGACLTSCSGGA